MIDDELKQDVKEIKYHVIELVKQGAIHNTILKEHEKRSTSLETRITPIEDSYKFNHKLARVLLSILGTGIGASLLAKLLATFLAQTQ